MQLQEQSASSEVITYGLIILAAFGGFLIFVAMLFATNFDRRQSMLGSAVLYMVLVELIGWILMRFARDSVEERETLKGNRHKLRRTYVWLLLAMVVLPRVSEWI